METLEMHAGFECIDPATYTWEALNRLADMAGAMGEPAIIPDQEAKANRLARCLREEWWLVEEGLFADVRAPAAEVRTALQAIDNWTANHPHDRGLQQQVIQAHRLFDPLLATRADLPQEIDLPWLLRHWVVMCPLEAGSATPHQARLTLARLMSAEFTNQWGMYLHPDRHDVMSINTGLLALAHARYGQIDQALDLTMRLAKTLGLHMPGAISEAMPDDWCFLQLWSVVGIVSPVVEGVLGIAPRAAERKLRVTPQLPRGWDCASLHRLRVGNSYFDIQATRNAQCYTISVTADTPNYHLELGVYLPEDDNVCAVALDGQPVEWHWETTNAGRCLVCKASGQANLVVTLA